MNKIAKVLAAAALPMAVACVAQGEDCTGGGLAGLGLQNDSTAASHVKSAPKSQVELGNSPTGAYGAQANATANAYYYNNKGAAYADIVSKFHAYWPNDAIMVRVDGACNLGAHPTTAMILQWAAHKWGFSPVVQYSETSCDGNWDMLHKGSPTLPDYGCSIGVDQVAYCNTAALPNHAIRGLAPGQPGHNLVAENTCFNADIQASFLYRFYSGASGHACSKGKLPITIAEWFNPTTCVTNTFSQRNCKAMAGHTWQAGFFNGENVPY